MPMIVNKSRNIDRLNHSLRINDIKTIYIITGSTKLFGKAYVKKISEVIDLSKYKIIYITNRTKLDGIDTDNSLLLLCDRWYMNPIVKDSGFQYLLNKVRISFPIDDVPVDIKVIE